MRAALAFIPLKLDVQVSKKQGQDLHETLRLRYFLQSSLLVQQQFGLIYKKKKILSII